MIEYVHGNIFDSDALVLVNPVNTVGVMGAGLALQFKKRYPLMYEQYKDMCKTKVLAIGSPKFCSGNQESNKVILLFPTKQDWRDPSKIEYIEMGLKVLHDNAIKYDLLPDFAFPKLGCGCGGLNWNTEVKPLMETYLSDLPCTCYIYQ